MRGIAGSVFLFSPPAGSFGSISFFRVAQLSSGSGRQTPAPNNALGGNEAFSQSQNLSGLAAQHQHLQAKTLVQVDMQAADDVGVVAVLNVRQFLRQVGGVMLKHHQHRSYALLHFVAACPSLAEQLFADKVSNGLGAVFIATALREGVKLRKQCILK
jgi:hypothetical protein